ncbi:ATP-dependent DNA helicase RecG [Paenibacillus curdlanolyticus YK9]|uniref:ATP-dependent DNA helicase RecG n=1 Tax=Paenibacillus curdlanolyticus YK9 TaxID=717606 RepID=E0I3V1_9BACL|nr:ATP-dependent DNA helicase RecG [Paenibacillus curdlanolyticus]EFM12965.1 ATP-dependent DNA helicase RecG [Paenibacillus curdlanolyticus YK9]
MKLDQIPVRQVKGVSAQKEGELHAFGVHTVADLLDYFPFRYEDYRLRDLTEVKDGEKVTVQGHIRSLPAVARFGRGKARMSCKVEIDHFLVTAVWFNRAFLQDQLVLGREITLTGKWDANRHQLTVSESEFPDRGKSRSGSLQPVYSVGGSLTQPFMRKAIGQALIQFGDLIEDSLPPQLISKHRLIPRQEAVMRIHHPEGAAEGQGARRRLVYEELFWFQLKLQAYRSLLRTRSDGMAFPIDSAVIRDFAARLPFELTDSQKKVVNEITQDMRQKHGMNRLLQGDVGSGKTVVAAIALYAAAKAGHQGALMVPTEILAEQHLRSLQRLFDGTGVEVGLLTGSVTARKRRDILAGLQMGMIDIAIGTHALIQDDVIFRSLGLVVTDEQHRFGVNQRSVLRRKGLSPDVLTMTATPIPRTLAITAFGDMDVSTLRERPKGRKPIKTHWTKPSAMDRVFEFIQREADQGRQAYVICPLIEESEKLDVQNAIDMHATIAMSLPKLKVGLLHGRMTTAEKDEAMRAFGANETQVLVATTVVEVGVDVPNATLIVIIDAERFGLSQLHQLRGRVGRGEHQSHCILVADPKSETGRERMKVMTETDDGFEVARKDLELRGPGDFFGTKQSGVPEFKLADMVADFETLEEAREDAAELTSEPDFWTASAYADLRQRLLKDPLFQGEQID